MQTAKAYTSEGELKRWLLDVLPGQGAWTDKEYLWLTDHTSRLVEFTDGFIEVLPMPTFRHQAVLKFLLIAFSTFVEPAGGTVSFSGLRLRLRKGKFREPDLLLLKDASDPRNQDRFWKGADLTLEVVSKDKPERDLIHKRHDYAEGRVPEYWIVNPKDQTIRVLKLQRRKYVEHGVFQRGDTANSVVLPGFSVSVDAVFDAK
jgi:Uma2 family endonuclease